MEETSRPSVKPRLHTRFQSECYYIKIVTSDGDTAQFEIARVNNPGLKWLNLRGREPPLF